MKKDSINGLDFFKFYRIEDFAAETLRVLLSQLLETFIENGSCVALIDLDKQQFERIAQAYRDLCVGYKHPRTTSLSWHYRPNDPTLLKLSSIFPNWMAHAPQSVLPTLTEKKPK